MCAALGGWAAAGRRRRRQQWRLAGLQRSQVVWERPPRDERRSASGHRGLPLLSKLYKATQGAFQLEGHTLGHTDTHAKSTSVEHRESFLHTPTHDGEEGGGGGAGFNGRRWQEISPTLHPAGRPSRQTCCRCRPGWTLWSSYWEEKRHNSPSLAF